MIYRYLWVTIEEFHIVHHKGQGKVSNSCVLCPLCAFHLREIASSLTTAMKEHVQHVSALCSIDGILSPLRGGVKVELLKPSYVVK